MGSGTFNLISRPDVNLKAQLFHQRKFSRLNKINFDTFATFSISVLSLCGIEKGMTRMWTVFGNPRDEDGNNNKHPRTGKCEKIVSVLWQRLIFGEKLRIEKVASLFIAQNFLSSHKFSWRALKEIQYVDGGKKKKDLKKNKHQWTPCGLGRWNKQHFAVTKFQFSIFADMILSTFIFHLFPI